MHLKVDFRDDKVCVAPGGLKGAGVEVDQSRVPSLFEALINEDLERIRWEADKLLGLTTSETSKEPGAAEVAQGLEKLRRQITGSTRAILDYTTVSGAMSLLTKESRPNASNLYDLGILSAACVFYESVYVAYPTALAGLDSPGTLGRIGLTWLNLEDSEINEFLYTHWSQVIARARSLSSGELSELRRRWTAILGLPRSDHWRQIEFDWQDAVKYKWSPDWLHGDRFYWTYDSGRARQALDFDNKVPPASLLQRQSGTLRRFVSVSTIRTFHYFRLSNLVSATYLPNSLRGPVFSLCKGRSLESVDFMNKVLGWAASALDREAAGFPTGLVVRPPMPLTAILSRLDSINSENFMSELEELRRQAKRFRNALALLFDAAIKGDVSEIKRLRLIVNDESQAASSAVHGAEIAREIEEAVLDFGPAMPALGAEVDAIKLVASLATHLYPTIRSGLQAVYNRLSRPYLYFLPRVIKESRKALSVKGQVERLWGAGLGPSDLEAFQRIGLGYPAHL